MTEFEFPFVILGEPGIGKTELMRKLGGSDKGTYFQAAPFLRQQNNSIQSHSLLIIDGLDEVAAMEPGDPLHNVLKKLIACGRPPFIVSCRTAEWRSATARLDIENEYGRTPKEFKLQPISEHQARQVLVREISEQVATNSIDELCSNGLATFFENPLNLEFLVTLLRTNGALPQSKIQLLNQSVVVLSQEHNEYQQDRTLAKLSAEGILDTAGCIMAMMLITGKECVARTQTSDQTFCLNDISDLVDFQTAEDVLGSRLFLSISDAKLDNVYCPLHRTVAEFLGARWLAREVEKTQSPEQVAQRIIGLLSAEGGFPASLRGLIAWLPNFNERLGSKVIEKDPYSVIYYGDSDYFSVGEARRIIDGLKQLARFDPDFIFDWWGMKSLKGLVQLELFDDVRSIIMDAKELANMRVFLLKAIKGEPIAKKMGNDLREVLFDSSRTIYERAQACVALCQINDSGIDWPIELERLSNLHNEDSDRLVVELLSEIGIENFSDDQIANSIVAHTGILKPNDYDRLDYSYQSLSHLSDTIPEERIETILDQLIRIVSPQFDADEWLYPSRQDAGLRAASNFVGRLIYRQLKYKLSSVAPNQLWNWLRVFSCESTPSTGKFRLACEMIGGDERLRLAIQRLALFTPGTESEFYFRLMRLTQLCQSFELTDEDARIHLTDLVSRNNPAEHRWWYALVDHFRCVDDQLIPETIQKLAYPFAQNDQKLIDFLTKKPKSPTLSELQISHKQRMEKRECQRKKDFEEDRKRYLAHISNILSGELDWISKPAIAYLGICSDLKTHCEPSEVISQWLGAEVKDAVLIGFEAILKRGDLPSATEVAAGYAKAGNLDLKITFPTIAAAIQRHLAGHSFNDLTNDLVLSLAILIENEYFPLNQQYPNLKCELIEKFSKNFSTREIFQQNLLEMMLAANMSNIPGLYQFVRDHTKRPISTQLCLEWLEKYPALPLNVVNDLTHCVIYAIDNERELYWHKLTKIADERCRKLIIDEKLSLDDSESDGFNIWRSILFVVNLEIALEYIPDITTKNRDLLWSLSRVFFDRFDQHTQSMLLTINQLKWLVMKFGFVWPMEVRPKGLTVGTENAWDATELIEWAIHQIAQKPTRESELALFDLLDNADESYTGRVQSAIAKNHSVRIETNFSSPKLCDMKSILKSQTPNSATDVQSIVLSELGKLQSKLNGHELNIVNDFYNDYGKPRTENECRDQMLIAMGDLPYGISPTTEVKMPQNKRSDGAFTFNNIVVPMEAKGQWNRHLWTAVENQLDRYYCKAHNSASKGIYVVFWFGQNAPKGKSIKRPPNHLPIPRTAEEMRVALEKLIPKTRSLDIAIYVLDVSKP